jgi:hypothetical protein
MTSLFRRPIAPRRPGNDVPEGTLRFIVRKQEISMAKPTAQQRQSDTAQPETSIIGLSIYSSDGTKIGEATQVGKHEGQEAIAAQLEPSLMGAKVLIPAKMMTQQGDRLELPMTAEQVRKQISKP